MSETPTELQARFLTLRVRRPARVLRRLQQSLAWAGFRIQPLGREMLRDHYFDTANRQLHAAGWSYRLRTRANRAEHSDDAPVGRLTLAALVRPRGAIFEFEALHHEFARHHADPARLPDGPLRARLQELLPAIAAAGNGARTDRGTQLVPQFTLQVLRLRSRLTHPDHPDDTLTLCWDDVAVDGNGAQPSGFTELVLQVPPGRDGQSPGNRFTREDSAYELFALALSVITAEPKLIEARLDRFRRTLPGFGLLPVPAEPGRAAPLHPDSRWIDAALAQLKAQRKALLLYEPHAWESVYPEGVHQLRVATRRTRAALRVFGDVLPATSASGLADDIRWLGRLLGAVRDRDVQLEAAAKYHKRVDADGARTLAAYRRHLERERAVALGRLRDALASPRHARLTANYRRLVRDTAVSIRTSEPTLASVARHAAAPLEARLLRRGRAIDDASPARHLHRLRIDAKRMRYQYEHLAPAFGATLAPVLDALQRLQTQLGRFQDACVAESHLREFRHQQVGDRVARRVLKRLAQTEARRAQRRRKPFAKEWRRLEDALRAFYQNPEPPVR